MMWTVDRALRRVADAGCRAATIPVGTRFSRVLTIPDYAEVGIRTWGAIDYLARCHDYHITRERS